ncbi:MAG: hypothetical protein LBQ79_11050 [Deltaproteobacteria bacterium]|jgi:hypothetical protein|nr:hypothetical protein [Deltaproteobacteria bacterium]
MVRKKDPDVYRRLEARRILGDIRGLLDECLKLPMADLFFESVRIQVLSMMDIHSRVSPECPDMDSYFEEILRIHAMLESELEKEP